MESLQPLGVFENNAPANLGDVPTIPKQIRINGFRIEEKKRIIFNFSYSGTVQKYFPTKSLSVEYDECIDDLDNSLLYIPAAALVLPVAWAIGAELRVKDLDRAFFDSFKAIRPTMKKWFPNFAFSKDIEVGRIATNSSPNSRSALLFSGGVDSTASYIRHKNENPHLITIWGADVLPDNSVFWAKVRSNLLEFSNKEEVQIHFVKTNARRFIYENLLTTTLGVEWWERVSHGLTILGICAPITVKCEIGKLYIASSMNAQHIDYPWGSTPFTDNKVRWASTKVIHDVPELTKEEKIKYIIKPYAKETGIYPFLRVCTSPSKSLNCGRCEKCYRTMTALAVAGVDPNNCGFNATKHTWKELKQLFGNHRLRLSVHRGMLLFHVDARTIAWKEIQTEIPEEIDEDISGSKEFLIWLRDFDLEAYGLEMERKVELKKLAEIILVRLYSLLATPFAAMPEKLQSTTRNLYRDMTGG